MISIRHRKLVFMISDFDQKNVAKRFYFLVVNYPVKNVAIMIAKRFYIFYRKNSAITFLSSSINKFY